MMTTGEKASQPANSAAHPTSEQRQVAEDASSQRTNEHTERQIAKDASSQRTNEHTERQIAEDASSLPMLERWRRALGALAKVMADPDQTDQVLVFSIYANAGSLPRRIHRFFEDANGRRLYEEHRTIDSRTIDLDALAALPEGTLGHAYAHFLKSRGLSPAVFDEPPSEVSDPRTSYVVQRLRQTHDLWHVVTNHNTDAPSEVALQAFTYAQMRNPSSLILATVGTLRSLREKPDLPRDVISSFRLGLRAERLATFPWEDHWSTPLAEVRALLGIDAEDLPKN